MRLLAGTSGYSYTNDVYEISPRGGHGAWQS